MVRCFNLSVFYAQLTSSPKTTWGLFMPCLQTVVCVLPCNCSDLSSLPWRVPQGGRLSNKNHEKLCVSRVIALLSTCGIVY